MKRLSTVGALRECEFRSRSVKQELRDNLFVRLRSGETLFPGIIGFDDSVIPQIVNAILSGHDVLLLGHRGQAKTRLMRLLPALLDEWTPTIAGSDLPDDPLQPKFAANRQLAEEHGDDLEIAWMHREERYHEKLATPDVTIADLIGEIDLVKHAQGRHLTDEGVIHYGLIPRTNRGIFGINELPDLAPRIQVGLFNALEERDVQIRGFPVRLPLDIFMVFTANPEDYTNRGRIVTPLKDRIGSVIRTHYPKNQEDALAITKENAWLDRDGAGMKIEIPRYMLEVVEEIAHLARKSPHINQESGVSVRTSIANAELLVSNAERRCLGCGETKVVPRISDLQHIAAGCRGKIEVVLAEDEKAEEKLIGSIVGEAVKNVFDNYSRMATYESIIEAFADKSIKVESGDDVPVETFLDRIRRIQGLERAAMELCREAELPGDDDAHKAAAAEFILEALYVNNRLSKYNFRGRTVFKR